MVVFQLSKVFFLICNRQCWFVCIFAMIIFISIDRLINPSITSKSLHCDAIHIQEHYMNNLSVSQLFRRKPVYVNLFEYELVNKDFCGKDHGEMDLLIFITSKSSSFERRHAIRRTYGNFNQMLRKMDKTLARLNIRLVFMINIDRNRMKSVLYEQKIFNDIVQVKMSEDELMNIYRDLAIFDWSSKYCRNARFILKMEELVFLNPFLLIQFINENENDRINLDLKRPLDINSQCFNLDARLPLLYGFIQSNQYVRRKPAVQNNHLEKYVVSIEEYPCQVYPTYLDDQIYLISSDARDLILCTFYRQTDVPLPISNVYLTGILAEYLNIPRQTLLDYQINLHSKISCEKFFIQTNPSHAFACILDDQSSENLFERYIIYWQSIINSQTSNQRVQIQNPG